MMDTTIKSRRNMLYGKFALRAHIDSAFGRTSFMLGLLYAMPSYNKMKQGEKKDV